MILGEQLKSWFAKFEKYKVTYKEGFFRLSNLANSPYTIIESFDKMPFCNHDREKKLILSNTLFLNAVLYYTEVEDGLWVLVSDLQFKKNMAMKNIYDLTLPMNYNFINLHYNNKKIKSKSMLNNGMILSDKTWLVFKPGNVNEEYHFKGSHENNITVYFTNEWLLKQQNSKLFFKNSNIIRFFESENTYLSMPDKHLSNDTFYEVFLALSMQNANNLKNNEIKELVFDFFKHFIDKSKIEITNQYYFKIADKDRKNIKKTEIYLLDNLLKSFPGIENTAQEVGISPTKLKNDFKTIHNQSMYHYYRYHQMNLAHKLISNNAKTIKEVANVLGYENASKFAAVFKEQFGVQPSSLLINN